MAARVLILGGRGRVGWQVAQDLLTYSAAAITITGRSPWVAPLSSPISYQSLDLADRAALARAIQGQDLVIHCAGPFHYRDAAVLKACLDQKVNYLDVSDHRSFYQKLIPYREAVRRAGITAITNTGIFPGISNSMVKQGIEQLDEPETIHLSYVVGGSGGAGLTVMRTTFLGLKTPFKVWKEGQWQTVLPYTEREIVEFPQPYGKTGVYWFDMPEAYTLPESFPVKTVITKFGSIPDFYNHLTWITAHLFPERWVASPTGLEFFSRISYLMTHLTDRLSGIGVAIRADITGKKNGKLAIYQAKMVHPHTAIAAGCGAGTVAQLLLSKDLNRSGLFPVEQILSTELFTQVMAQRNIKIEQQLSFRSS